MSLYATLFTDLLMAALQGATVRVQAAAPLVPEAERQDAWHWLSYALQQPALWPQTRTLVLALAPKMEQAGHRQDWLGYLQSAYGLAQQQADEAAQAELAYQIGLLYRLLTHYDEAMRWLYTGLTTFQQLGERRGQAQVLNEMAWVEHLRRRYAEAKRYVEQALLLSADDSHERGMSYRVQGMIAIHHSQWEQAEQHHRAALTTFAQQGDQRKVAWSLVNIGIALRGQKQFKAAVESCTQATKILEQLNDTQHWIIAQVNLGIAYYYLGLQEDAVRCYLKAEEAAFQLQDQFRLADIYVNLGLARISQENYEAASDSFRSSILLYKRLDILNMVVNSMDGLAMSYIAWQRYDQALAVLDEAISMLPQIVNVPNYQYYHQSLTKHREDAQAKLTLSFTPNAGVV